MSAAATFLTPEEMTAVTGYARRAGQVQWLRDRGWRFELDRDGNPRVARAYMERRMVGDTDAPAVDDFYPPASPWCEQPWKQGGLSPIAWMDKNLDAFRFSRDEVVVRASGPQHWWRGIDSQGFYFLLLCDRVVYVGISNNIPARIEQHKKSSKRFNSVAAFRAPQFVAQWMEAYYYEAWKPEYNERPERLDPSLLHHLPQ